MSKMCNRIITELKDPLVIQPAALELATIRKKPEDELVSNHNSICVWETEIDFD